MVWLSSGKLDGVFRDAWSVDCHYSGNDYAVAPVRLNSVRNLRRSPALGSPTHRSMDSTALWG